MKRLKIYLLIFLLIPILSIGQTQYQLSSESDFKIVGTSTLHDWEMVSNQSKGKAYFELDKGAVVSAKDVKVAIPSQSLKSGKNAMDKNAYVALKTQEHKEIFFELSSLVKKGSDYEAVGQFEIAGVKKRVNLPVNIQMVGQKIKVTGKYPFNLTDYQIDPPTAMLGTIKTGNAVTVHFQLLFQNLN
jgi:polyisoprenoid-binding protein YceI